MRRPVGERTGARAACSDLSGKSMVAESNVWTDTVAAAPFGIMHGGSWRFLLQSDGKVGIGTISPTALLEVAGTLKLSSGGKLVFPDGTSLASASTAGQQTITSGDSAV